MNDSIRDRRAHILAQIEGRVRSWPILKAERAKRIGVTEAQLDDLLHGRFDGFTLDDLARIGARTGVIVIY